MTDLGRAQHMHDRDDLLAESAERQLRAKLDNAFDTFRKKMEDLPQCRIHFEKPFKELGYVLFLLELVVSLLNPDHIKRIYHIPLTTSKDLLNSFNYIKVTHEKIVFTCFC